jgi:MFS family permease
VATAPASPPPPARALSLGVIFLTLYIDLVGFSIIFPLVPNLIGYYLKIDGRSGVLGALLAQSDSVAHWLGHEAAFSAVLFGGVMMSLFSVLQFIFSPIWGGLSDRHGRRPVLLTTVAGTALGYLIWFFSGSFWLFLLSRLVSGAFSGNLSVATAAVADVTTRAERAKAMGIVGAAFGLGLVTGPALGGISSALHWDLLTARPDLARWGINPFSVPALIALTLCLLNQVWIYRRFKETLPPSARAERKDARVRNPLRAILLLDNANVRRANVVAFVHSVAFVAMETSLTFLAAQRFGYGVTQNTKLMVWLGFFSILTQAYILRKILKGRGEVTVLSLGLGLSVVGLVTIGVAPQPWVLYTGLAVLAVGAGLVNPSTSGLISLYSEPSEQGRVLGIFRSLGSLSRAITPLLAGILFWACGSTAVFIAGAVIAVGALALARRLPQPAK